MHFSKIYIQQNFVPDVVTDPFGRKVIGLEVTVNDGEILEEAERAAEEYIKEYIQRNTVTPPHNHIEERYIPEAELPSIQKDPMEEKVVDVWVKDIEKCETLEQLKTWVMLATQYPKIRQALEMRSIIIKADLLLPPKK